MDPYYAAYVVVAGMITNIFAAKKAKKARKIAEANANAFEMESYEKYRRTTSYMNKQRGAAEAYAAASGISGGGTAEAGRNLNIAEQERQKKWMLDSTARQASIIRKGGQIQSNNIMNDAMANWAMQAGGAIVGGRSKTTPEGYDYLVEEREASILSSPDSTRTNLGKKAVTTP